MQDTRPDSMPLPSCRSDVRPCCRSDRRDVIPAGIDNPASATTAISPARAGSFHVIPPPRRLHVPLVGVGPTDVTPLAQGTAVVPGEPLIRVVPQSAPAPLS